jgi:branched-chain amino acid transport system permease protein
MKRAFLVALAALGILLPLLGLKTVTNMQNKLELQPNFELVFSIVASIFFALAAKDNSPKSTFKLPRFSLPSWFFPALFGAVVLYPLFILLTVGPSGALKWIDNFGIQILIYIMLGWGLNIVVGLAGLLDLVMQRNPPFGRFIKPCDTVKNSGFPRPIWANNRRNIALLRRK